MASEKMLVGRHKRVAFMDADGSGKTFTRSDVVGYAPAIDYEFDRYTNDPVHEKIAAITDDEILGTEAQVDIVVVDLFEQKTSETTCTARKRTWSVIPDTEGDGTEKSQRVLQPPQTDGRPVHSLLAENKEEMGE